MPGESREAVVLLSGGLDSMVAAALARERGFAINALTIDYNQRHRREIEAAREIARLLGAARHVVLPLDLRRFGGSALTDDLAVPKDGVGEDIPVTYVPARNLIFLALTLGWAERLATRDGLEGQPFRIHAPLQDWGKARIALEARRLGLDPALSWSCYDPTGEGLACGLCDSCRLRRAGFAEAGIEDSTRYAAPLPGG